MNKRYITWEIIVAGIALTLLSLYVMQYTNQPDSSSSAFISTPSNPFSQEAPDSPSSSSDPPAILNLDPKDFKDLEKLKKLKEVKNLAKLKQELQSLFSEEQFKQMEKQFEKELQKLGESEIQVQFDQNDQITVQKRYQTPTNEWIQVQSGDYIYRAPLSKKDLNQLNFSLSFGKFNVMGGNSDNPLLSLRAHGNIESATKLKQEIDLEVNESDDQTTINVDNNGNSGFFRHLNVEATLFIPSKTRVIASTNGGHITARELSNLTQLSTNGGHITLKKVFGKSEVETKGGHITIKNSGGTLTANTSGGHIKLIDYNGNASVSTNGGHLYFRQINGGVTGSTSGGNIEASFDSLTSDSKLSTSAGNINLKLPATAAARIELNGMSTDIADVFNFSGTTEQGSIKGVISPENSTIDQNTLPQIKASCNFGNVSLSVYE